MDYIPWALAALFAVLTAALAFRKREDPYPDAVARLSDALEEGADPEPPHPDDPEEVRRIRAALARGWKPLTRRDEDPGEAAMEGLVRYLTHAVISPLRVFRDSGRAAEEIEAALNALEDLTFYVQGSAGEEPLSAENLQAVIQGVTREYALETGVPIKFRGPSSPLSVRIAPEAFKDALFLLLANAGRFGGGQTVEVVVEAEGEQVCIRVRDRGKGFSSDAIDRAFDPFWTTDADALGLGLTHAARLVERQGGRVAIGNTEGGGEVVLTFPRKLPGGR